MDNLLARVIVLRMIATAQKNLFGTALYGTLLLLLFKIPIRNYHQIKI